MSASGFSQADASALQGRTVRSISKQSIVPPGSQGRVVGMRELEDSYEIVVSWEANPAFVMPTPIQVTYSKSEAAAALQIVD